MPASVAAHTNGMPQPTALITGASSGIGAAVARALSGRHRLLLVARRADRLAALASELGGDAVTLAADLADPASLPRIAACVAGLGGLDALVNNAGLFTLADCATIDAAHLDRLLAVNVRAPMLLTAACLPHLRPGATIVNLSSQAVEHAFPGCGAYTACKCAIEGWSRVLREELRPRRIRVCVVSPGATDTEIWPAQFAGADRSRMARPADVAAAVRLAIDSAAGASIDRIAIAPPGGSL